MSDHQTVPPEAARDKYMLARREFLVLGSAAIAGAAASTVTAGTMGSISSSPVGAVLSVGYTDAISRVGSVHQMEAGSSVVSAERFLLSDRRFRDGSARVTVHGVWHPEGRRGDASSIRITSFSPHADGPLPFFAWQHSMDERGRRITSKRANFVAALDADGALPLAIERNDRAAAPVRRLKRLLSYRRTESLDSTMPSLAALEKTGNVCRLSVGDAGDARLRAGTYFIALRESLFDRAPNWSSITIDGDIVNRTSSLLHQGGRPVEFGYLTVSIEPAIA
jgi:hypothetical protein